MVFPFLRFPEIGKGRIYTFSDGSQWVWHNYGDNTISIFVLANRDMDGYTFFLNVLGFESMLQHSKFFENELNKSILSIKEKELRIKENNTLISNLGKIKSVEALKEDLKMLGSIEPVLITEDSNFSSESLLVEKSDRLLDLAEYWSNSDEIERPIKEEFIGNLRDSRFILSNVWSALQERLKSYYESKALLEERIFRKKDSTQNEINFQEQLSETKNQNTLQFFAIIIAIILGSLSIVYPSTWKEEERNNELKSLFISLDILAKKSISLKDVPNLHKYKTNLDYFLNDY